MRYMSGGKANALLVVLECIKLFPSGAEEVVDSNKTQQVP